MQPLSWSRWSQSGVASSSASTVLNAPSIWTHLFAERPTTGVLARVADRPDKGERD
jgi:hypothetical protein